MSRRRQPGIPVFGSPTGGHKSHRKLLYQSCETSTFRCLRQVSPSSLYWYQSYKADTRLQYLTRIFTVHLERYKEIHIQRQYRYNTICMQVDTMHQELSHFHKHWERQVLEITIHQETQITSANDDRRTIADTYQNGVQLHVVVCTVDEIVMDRWDFTSSRCTIACASTS